METFMTGNLENLRVLLIGAGIASIILYIYMALAFMAMGKKAKLNYPALSWIPGFGPMIIAFQASKMHWWPWLMLIAGAIPFIGVIASVVFFVYGIIWNWKLMEAINKPGWWAILFLIPIVNLIMIGIAAWSKE